VLATRVCLCRQAEVCHALEEQDGQKKFLVEKWSRAEVNTLIHRGWMREGKRG